jgi:hypothetical protein
MGQESDKDGKGKRQGWERNETRMGKVMKGYGTTRMTRQIESEGLKLTVSNNEY